MRTGATSGPDQRLVRDAVAIWIAFALTYMVFAGSVGVNEGLAGFVCASLATTWWWRVGRRGGHFRFDFGLLRPLGPALLGLAPQTVRIGYRLMTVLLGHAARGTTRERSAADVAWATPVGPTAPAARAVGLLAASLAPDSYVLTLDRAHGTVATHALEDKVP